MPYSAYAIANAFLEIARRDGSVLTNMQLQKLVYIAHGFHLALQNGEPLTYNNTHAWKYGPVIPRLYKRLQHYGAGVVDHYINSEDAIDLDSSAGSVINAVWKSYGSMSGGQLSAITHREGTPWDIMWNTRDEKWKPIPDDLIREHYSQLVNNP